MSDPTTWRDAAHAQVVAVALLVMMFLPFFFYPAVTNRLPLGYGAFYALMAEGIVDNHFALPREVPYYGPGGVPFAYPPLSFYLMAAVTQSTGMSPMTYMRYAPPLIMVVAVVAMFFLAHAITASAFEATIAAILFAISPATIALQSDTGGVCRGVGLVAALITVMFVYKALRDSTARSVVLAALFLAATILSHFAYAVFAVVSMATFGVRSWPRVWRLVLIAAIAGVLIMPWWLLVIHRHGLIVFTRITDTHDSTGFIRFISSPRALGGVIMRDFLMNGSPLGIGSAILGVARDLSVGAWFLPGWLFATALFTGSEGARFAAVVGALLGASVVRALGEQVVGHRTPAARAYPARAIFFGALLLFSYVYAFAQHVVTATPAITDDLLRVASWTRQHTPAESRYLLLSDNSSQHEFMTYLVRREPAVSYFGAEWTGRYREQTERVNQIIACVRQRSYSCVDSLMHRQHLAADLLIASADLRPESIASRIDASGEWQRVYEDGHYAVWQRSANNAPSQQGGASLRPGGAASCTGQLQATSVHKTAWNRRLQRSVRRCLARSRRAASGRPWN